MKRLFCICIGAFILVTYLTLTFGKPLLNVLTVIFALLFLASSVLCVFKRKPFLILLSLISLFSIAALFKTYFIDLEKLERAKSLDQAAVTAEGKVISFNKSSSLLSFVIEIDELDCRVKVMSGKTELDVDVGKTVEFSGTLEFDPDTNREEEAFLSCYADKVNVLPSSSFIVKIRDSIRNSSEGSQNNGFLKALLIGDKSDLSSEIKSDFKKLGTSHVLSISGLHLSIVVMSVYSFLISIGVNRRLSSIISIALALFYMALTGFALSVVRAGQMMIIYLLMRISRRTNDSVNALFIAAFVIVCRSAWSLYSTSFLLSFSATLGILVFLPYAVMWLDKRKLEWIAKNGYPTRKAVIKFKITEYLLVSLYSTLSATVFTLPVIFVTFNAVSLFSPIANLLLVFFVKYILTFAFLGSLTHLSLFYYISDALTELMLSVSHLLAEHSFNLVGVDMGFTLWAAVIATAIIIISLFFCRKILALPIISVLTLIVFIVFNFSIHTATNHHLRVSVGWENGRNTVLVSLNDKNYLLDQTSVGAKTYDISALMEKRGIDTLHEAVIAIENQEGADSVIHLSDFLNIEKITVLIPPDCKAYTHKLKEACELNNVELNVVLSNKYQVTPEIAFFRTPKSFQGFTLKKNGKTVGFYKSLSSTYVTLPECDVAFYDGKFSLQKTKRSYAKGELAQSFWRITDKRIITE